MRGDSALGCLGSPIGGLVCRTRICFSTSTSKDCGKSCSARGKSPAQKVREIQPFIG